MDVILLERAVAGLVMKIKPWRLADFIQFLKRELCVTWAAEAAAFVALISMRNGFVCVLYPLER